MRAQVSRGRLVWAGPDLCSRVLRQLLKIAVAMVDKNKREILPSFKLRSYIFCVCIYLCIYIDKTIIIALADPNAGTAIPQESRLSWHITFVIYLMQQQQHMLDYWTVRCSAGNRDVAMERCACMSASVSVWTIHRYHRTATLLSLFRFNHVMLWMTFVIKTTIIATLIINVNDSVLSERVKACKCDAIFNQ